MTIIPVQTGPAACPMSIVDDNAPMDAPISSFLATSATYALVATVESEVPAHKTADLIIFRNNAG